MCLEKEELSSSPALFGKKTADNMHRGFGVGFLQFFWTHEIKPLITLMLASQALRSCSRLEHALA